MLQSTEIMHTKMNFKKNIAPYALVGLFLLLTGSVFFISSQLSKNQVTTQQTRAAGVTTTLSLPPLPPGLPQTFEFGLFNEDTSTMHPNVPYYWRYGYIAGWSPSNVTSFIQASLSHSPAYHSAFAYYWIYGSLTNCPYGDGNEVQKLNNAQCMNEYYTDFKNFMIATHNATTAPVVYVFEPDLDGTMQSDPSNTNDNAALQSTQVVGSGMPDVAGYPNNYAAFHQAIAHLRDLYAPNVILADDISIWATGQDLTICLRNGGCDWQTIANRTATYLNSFGSGFNMVSFSPLDRDAAYYQISSGSNRWWWDDNSREPKFTTVASWLGSISTQTNKRVIMWQVPNGNRQYLAENNTDGHYQDNRTEYFLNATNGRANISLWMNSGVVGLMWGAGAGGQSHYWDAKSDGITNPASISNGNPMGIATHLTSNVADDDGGYIRYNVTSYYQQGALPLPDYAGPSPTPTPIGSPAPTLPPTPTNTPAPSPTPGQTMTVTFDDLSNPERALTGQYPTGVIDWGSSSWYLSGPWLNDTTNSVTFNGTGVTTATFNFINPTILSSITAFSSLSSGQATVTISCPGQPTVTQVLTVAGQLVPIATNWTGACTSVTLSSTNGWATNFDNLVLNSTQSVSPTPTPTTGPAGTPTPTPIPDTIPPTVSISSPLNGSIVSRGTTVLIQANATDNVGVSKVNFLVNNTLKCSDTATPYSCNWQVPNKRGATYTITATAYDAANNSASQRISVTAR